MSISPIGRSTLDEVSTATEELDAPIALYVHIPFCLSKCNYCDFNTYEGIESLMPPFVDALSTEIELWGKRLDRAGCGDDLLRWRNPFVLAERIDYAAL